MKSNAHKSKSNTNAHRGKSNAHNKTNAYSKNTAHKTNAHNKNTTYKTTNRNKRTKVQQPPSKMGKYYSHFNNTLVLKITSQDLPFPNQNIYLNNEVIGKSDEVFGKVDSPFVSILLNSEFQVRNKDGEYYCDRMMKKEWLQSKK